MKLEISQKITSLPWYIEALEGIAREVLDNGEELDTVIAMEKFLMNFLDKPSQTNQKIAEKLNIYSMLKKAHLIIRITYQNYLQEDQNEFENNNPR